MRRLTRFLFLGFLIVIFCTACNGNITRDIRHAGFNMGGEFVCNDFLPSDKDDTSYDEIRYMTGNHIINSEGKIYELSLSQKFANDENCKDAATDIFVQAIFDDKIVKGIDARYYYLVAQNETPVYTAVTVNDNSYDLYDLLLKDIDIVKVTTVDSSNGIYYVLKTDGNIYSYKVSKADRDAPLTVSEMSIVYNESQYGRIIDYNYAGENLGTFIRTENKMYRMRATNFEDCSKYADVKCTYELQEDPIFETYRDVIISYNGNMLITNYGQEFTVAS